MLWLMLLMREQALVQDVHSAYRSPSLLWRLACELAPSPHLPLLLGRGAWQMRLFAGWQPIRRSSLPAKTTLALFMVLVYGRYHLLRQPLPSDCEWQQGLTSGLPAVPLLSALAFLFHLAPICCTASSLSSFCLSSLPTSDRQR